MPDDFHPDPDPLGLQGAQGTLADRLRGRASAKSVSAPFETPHYLQGVGFLASARLRAGRNAVLKAVLPRSEPLACAELVLSLSKGQAEGKRASGKTGQQVTLRLPCPLKRYRKNQAKLRQTAL